jgi:hypothetical protein
MKRFLIGLGLLSVVVLAGCGKQTATQTNAPAGPEKVTQQVEQKSDSIVASIKDAMGLGKQMKCTYATSTDGSKFESTAFIDGKKFRSTSLVAGKTANVLFDGDAMWTWMEGQKIGTKMTMACINDLKSLAPQSQPSAAAVQSPDDQFKDVTNTNCVPATDADFSVPSTVTFTDQCEMLKKATGMMKNLPTGAVPGGVPSIPGMPNLPTR